MSTRTMIADSARPELRDLAHDVIANQTAELAQLQRWRAEWYPDMAPTFATGSSMMSSSMMGSSMMGRDEMYLQMMIGHHRLAVDMAKRAQLEATHPQLRELAETMAAHQAQEIDRMRGYLGSRTADAED